MKERERGGSSEHTMLIRMPTRPEPAPAARPEGGGREWRPFRFANLERVSKRQTRLLGNLEWMLPSVPTTGAVSEALRQRLHEMLDEPVSLETEFVHLVPVSRLRRYVGSPTFLAVLTPHPNKTRGLLEVELGLAHQAIDMLLGGTGEAVALRPLTDIEEGVMTYVIIELLKVLTPSLDPSLPKLRIEGVVTGFEEAAGLLGEDESLCVVQLRAAFGQHAGYLRLFIPEAVLAAANPPADSGARRERRLLEATTNAGRLAGVKVELRAEVGEVEITTGDLAQLRERDVVLLEALSCRPDRGEGGTARLCLGQSGAGHFEAEVVVESGRLRARVTGFSRGPMGHPDAGGEGVAPGDEGNDRARLGDVADESTSRQPGRGRADVDDAENAGGAEVLNDIPLQIAVEVGRVSLTADELVSLKVGHVFDLNRVSGEPLDLSVNGRIVARGELVEVDGNLGVRIVNLAG